MTTPDMFRMVAMLISLIGIAIWLVWARRFEDRWRYAVAPITWLAHIMIYYGAYFISMYLGTYETLFFTNWSLVVRMQSILTISGAGLLLIEQDKLR